MRCAPHLTSSLLSFYVGPSHVFVFFVVVVVMQSHHAGIKKSKNIGVKSIVWFRDGS